MPYKRMLTVSISDLTSESSIVSISGSYKLQAVTLSTSKSAVVARSGHGALVNPKSDNKAVDAFGTDTSLRGWDWHRASRQVNTTNK
jgi:hypothetical protein